MSSYLSHIAPRSHGWRKKNHLRTSGNHHSCLQILSDQYPLSFCSDWLQKSFCCKITELTGRQAGRDRKTALFWSHAIPTAVLGTAGNSKPWRSAQDRVVLHMHRVTPQSPQRHIVFKISGILIWKTLIRCLVHLDHFSCMFFHKLPFPPALETVLLISNRTRNVQIRGVQHINLLQ